MVSIQYRSLSCHAVNERKEARAVYFLFLKAIMTAFLSLRVDVQSNVESFKYHIFVSCSQYEKVNVCGLRRESRSRRSIARLEPETDAYTRVSSPSHIISSFSLPPQNGTFLRYYSRSDLRQVPRFQNGRQILPRKIKPNTREMSYLLRSRGRILSSGTQRHWWERIISNAYTRAYSWLSAIVSDSLRHSISWLIWWHCRSFWWVCRIPILRWMVWVRNHLHCWY